MAEDINTEVALLKKEVTDIKFIFSRLDTAIERMVDVSSSVNRMLAVHEEKISQQEEASIRADTEFKADIKELHSRITTNTKEMMQAITSQHLEQQQTLDRMRVELNNRVGILEKWRWIIIGGSIVVGFALQKMPIWG
jgi:hypothetical protein|tara:strand:- start:1152 stop:1565 length:414 start_codon:yes stop_codon:yes gene_type:complete